MNESGSRGAIKLACARVSVWHGIDVECIDRGLMAPQPGEAGLDELPELLAVDAVQAGIDCLGRGLSACQRACSPVSVDVAHPQPADVYVHLRDRDGQRALDGVLDDVHHTAGDRRDPRAVFDNDVHVDRDMAVLDRDVDAALAFRREHVCEARCQVLRRGADDTVTGEHRLVGYAGNGSGRYLYSAGVLRSWHLRLPLSRGCANRRAVV